MLPGGLAPPEAEICLLLPASWQGAGRLIQEFQSAMQATSKGRSAWFWGVYVRGWRVKNAARRSISSRWRRR